MKSHDMKDMTAWSTWLDCQNLKSLRLPSSKHTTSLITYHLSINHFHQTGGLTLALPLDSSLTVHWFLFHHDLSLSMRPKQTAADRQWIKTDQMLSFRAADGQRGDWVKGSCLIIQGSSLKIVSKSKSIEILIFFYLTWGWGAVLCNIDHSGSPHNPLPWLKSVTSLIAENLPFRKAKRGYCSLFFTMTLNHTHPDLSGWLRLKIVDVCIHSSWNVVKLHTIKLFWSKKTKLK